MRKLRFVAAVLCVLSGCGGSPAPDVQNAPESIQRMMLGGRVLSGGSVPASPTPTVTITIAGYRSNYTVIKDQTTNVVTVTNNITNVVQTYNNPNLIKFVDTYTSFDINGPAGQVYRLYQAAFNRKPDLPGLGFWIAASQNGRDMTVIASDFIVSNEFKTMYGDKPTNLKLVSSFYNNVLHRDGEKAGVDWWVGQMNGGATANGVLFGFSDSAENKTNLQAAMQNGFDYIPFQPSGPKVPQPSSYSNMKDVGLAQQVVPVEAGGMPQDGFAYFHAYGFADFFRDGDISLVTASTEYLNDPNATPSSAVPGHIKFWRKDDKGSWVDHTKDLLADNTGCLLARKVVIADFNGDGRPDVFFACHGFDAAPFPGEHPRLLLSQQDGTYINKLMDFNCFCHGAAAADFNKSGFADIVVADFLGGKGAYFLKNNKDGTFTVDTTRLPADAVRLKGAIFSVDLVDMNSDGKLDVWLAGNEPDWPTSIFLNDGSNSFSASRQIVMPAVATYSTPMDIVVDAGYAYVLRTSNHYDGAAIQKVNLSTMQSDLIYQNNEYYQGQPIKWVDWITIRGDSVVSINAVFGVSVKK